jgi:hypothetical protein
VRPHEIEVIDPENGAWKVMNLTFSSRTTGCPDQ